jgi:hypothetical protein
MSSELGYLLAYLHELIAPRNGTSSGWCASVISNNTKRATQRNTAIRERKLHYTIARVYQSHLHTQNI